jgi:hypothetical protein
MWTVSMDQIQLVTAAFFVTSRDLWCFLVRHGDNGAIGGNGAT